MRWGEAGSGASSDDGFVLPVGTVTLLLADMAGSVRAWEADSQAMTVVVAQLDELITEIVAANGGVRPIEQGEGDSFVAAFARASDALAAAFALQVRTALASWPGGLTIVLRMALHSGEVQLRNEGNYIGSAINRCARIRALAHGGQVLLSAPTHDLVLDALPEGCQLVDLGVHRLRDLARPEHVYQLSHPDLPAEFPPLRSLDRVANNLPSRLTTFVGRERELRALRDLLLETRLVTLTGSGGCGKTRLAVQLAAEVVDEYPDGAWFVDLATVTDAASVPRAVAAAVGVTESRFEAITDTVTREMGSKCLLLILDNCEHLIDVCAGFVNELLQRCPRVTVLATSREQLGVEGELVWRVPSLTLPANAEPPRIDSLRQCEAVRLFIDRAVQVRPDFEVTNDNAPAVAEICQRLDGIPLAIELAAARARVLTAQQIADGLIDRFSLLTGGARTTMPRQQTLEASIEWSYGLLDNSERSVLRRLSTFMGGFTLEAAVAVCQGDDVPPDSVLDLLTALVDKSLVLVDDDGSAARYRLLETIRQFARERLDDSATESADARDRHLLYYVQLAEKAAPELEGSNLTSWVQLLDAEIGNLRLALDRAASTVQPDAALRITAGLTRYWYLRTQREGRDRLEAALALDGGAPALRAGALITLCFIAAGMMDVATASACGEEALTIARELGDDALAARTLCWLGWGQLTSDRAAAVRYFDESITLLRQLGDDITLADALNGRAAVEGWGGNVLVAVPLLEEAFVVAQRSRKAMPSGYSHLYMGLCCTCLGSFVEAERHFLEALERFRKVGDEMYEFMALTGLGTLRILQGRHSDARDLLGEAHGVAAHLSNVALARVPDAWVGYVAYLEGDFAEAESAMTDAMPYLVATSGWISPMHLVALADIAHRRDDVESARVFIDQATTVAEQAGSLYGRGRATLGAARLALDDGAFDHAETGVHEALVIATEAGDRTLIVDALEVLATVALRLESVHEAARLFGATAAARESLGYPRSPIDAARVEPLEGSIEEALGADEATRLHAEGQALALDAVVTLVRRGRGQRKRPSSGWASLTPTELEVVRLVAGGLTNPEIAERLFVARSTVKGHVSNILAKLGVSTRTELAAEAVRREPKT